MERFYNSFLVCVRGIQTQLREKQKLALACMQPVRAAAFQFNHSDSMQSHVGRRSGGCTGLVVAASAIAFAARVLLPKFCGRNSIHAKRAGVMSSRKLNGAANKEVPRCTATCKTFFRL